jgi:hypothetical protein
LVNVYRRRAISPIFQNSRTSPTSGISAIHWILLGLALFAGEPVAARAQVAASETPRVTAELSSDRIYQGDGVDYQVVVHDVTPQGRPEVSESQDYEIEFIGDRSMNMSSTLDINGVVRREHVLRHVFGFRLVPTRSGTIEIPPAVYRHAGREYRGPALRLDVVAPQPSELAILDTRVERGGDLPLEPFAITLRVFVKRLPDPYLDRDPVTDLRGDPPVLSVPWTRPPEGLAAGSLEAWLGKSRMRQGGRGFRIDGITLQGVDDGDPFVLILGGDRVSSFDLRGRPATAQDASGVAGVEGVHERYYVYTLRREFEPRRAGTFAFPAPSLRGEFVTRVDRGRSTSESVFTAGRPVEVVVGQAPTATRPAGFTGLYGHDFEASVEATPRSARVGDPIAFELRLRGRGTLETMSAPDLAAIPAIAERFAVEAAGAEGDASERRFKYVLRARSDGVDAVPPVAITFYDVAGERYGTVSSSPLPIAIDAVTALDAADIVSGARGSATREFAEADGLFGNVVDPSRLRDERVDLEATLLAAGSLLAFHALAAGWLALRSRRGADPARTRARGAAARSRARLAGATDTQAAQASLLALIADALHLEEAGLTSREALAALERSAIDAGTLASVRELLDDFDRSRFGGGGDAASLVGRARDVVEELIAAFERGGRLR